jgi:hypothetical protein
MAQFVKFDSSLTTVSLLLYSLHLDSIFTAEHILTAVDTPSNAV